MKSTILIAALYAFALTSCISSEEAFTPLQLNQVRPGVTTEAELMGFFGPPDTKLTTFSGSSTITWFRCVGIPPAGYIPLAGPTAGGLDLEVQQLTILTGIGGRVTRVNLYDSHGEVQTEERLAAFRIGTFGK